MVLKLTTEEYERLQKSRTASKNISRSCKTKKITPMRIMTIKNLIRNGESTRRICTLMHCSRQTVDKIKNGAYENKPMRDN